MAPGILSVAAHELRRYRGFMDLRLLAFLAVMALAVALAAPLFAERGLHPDEGLFVAEVEPRSPLGPPLEADPAFEVVEGRGVHFVRGEADILVVRGEIFYHRDNDKSVGAANRLEEAVRRWLENALIGEADQDAAFPVRVDLAYESRAISPGTVGAPPSLEPSPTPTTDPGSPTDGPAPETTPPAPRLNVTAPPDQQGLTPDQIDPPFPMQGLLLTFAFIIPVNFLVQFYSGSLLEERTNKRALILLSTPHPRLALLAAKTLPYLGAGLAISIVVTFLIGSNLVGFLASLPILLFALATSLLIGLLARSPRELTFLLTSTTVLLSTFLFLPAIFTQVHPVSFLSPVTVIVRTIDGDPVQFAQFLYATLPMTVAALAVASLAGALWREEHLFAPKTLTAKFLDATQPHARTRPRLVGAGILAVPFALGLEVFVLIFAVTLDLGSAFLLFLLGGALVEEGLKALPIVAHLTRTSNPRSPWVVGPLVGLGFFVGEKVALAASLIGFDLLPRGPDALATFGIGPTLLIVFAPLALHAVACTVTAVATAKHARLAPLGWITATLLHAAYNVTVVRILLAGGTA